MALLVNRVYIGNIHFEATEMKLREFLTSLNFEPKELRYHCDRSTGRALGFAFVEFADAETAHEAIHFLDGEPFMGRALRVKPATPKKALEEVGGRSRWSKETYA